MMFTENCSFTLSSTSSSAFSVHFAQTPPARREGALADVDDVPASQVAGLDGRASTTRATRAVRAARQPFGMEERERASRE